MGYLNVGTKCRSINLWNNTRKTLVNFWFILTIKISHFLMVFFCLIKITSSCLMNNFVRWVYFFSLFFDRCNILQKAVLGMNKIQRDEQRDSETIIILSRRMLLIFPYVMYNYKATFVNFKKKVTRCMNWSYLDVEKAFRFWRKNFLFSK